jgi:hypothetical protein
MKKNIIFAALLIFANSVSHVSYSVFSSFPKEQTEPSLKEWKSAFASLPKLTQQKVTILIQNNIHVLKAFQKKSTTHSQKMTLLDQISEINEQAHELVFEIFNLQAKALTPNADQRIAVESQAYSLTIVSNKIALIMQPFSKTSASTSIYKHIPSALKKLHECLSATQKTRKATKNAKHNVKQ